VSTTDPSERQKRLAAEVEQGYTQGEAAGRQGAREAGYEPLDAHGHDEPGTVGHDRPGSRKSD
jgi:hypothetical protein